MGISDDFICCGGLHHDKYTYGGSEIEGKTTTMMPKNGTTTVKNLLNTLILENTASQSYISIDHNGKNSDFKGTNQRHELKQYFSSKITGILCIKKSNGTMYYDIRIDNERIKSEKPTIEQIQSKLTNFNFKERDEPENIIISDGYIDFEKEYHITPKKGCDVTVGYLTSILKGILNNNVYLYINSNKYNNKGLYKKLKDIPQKYHNLKITEGTIHFGGQGIYCNVSSLYINQDELYKLLENNFYCNNTSNNNTILVNNKEDTGILYNFRPKNKKTTVTVKDFLKQININFEKTSYISIDCPKLERTTNYQNLHGDLNLSIISDIDLEASKDNSKKNSKQKTYDIKNFKITSGDVTIGKNGIYYAITIEPIFKKDGEEK